MKFVTEMQKEAYLNAATRASDLDGRRAEPIMADDKHIIMGMLSVNK